MEGDFFAQCYLEKVNACPVCGGQQSQTAYAAGEGVLAKSVPAVHTIVTIASIRLGCLHTGRTIRTANTAR